MNSVAPISSLATTADSLLEDIGKGDAATDTEHLNDVRGAVSTIARRSEGLLSFVQAYRSVTRVPTPDRKRFRVSDLANSVSDLMRPITADMKVSFECIVEQREMELHADREMIEQVLINLVKNAAEAAAGNGAHPADGLRPSHPPEVRLRAFVDPRGHTIIEVTDNGPGIPQETLEKVFVPFFTTKKEGSGIGLSLSREVMRRHGGTIALTSGPNGTTATLRF
jgi:signal transduction histidine kinase